MMVENLAKQIDKQFKETETWKNREFVPWE